MRIIRFFIFYVLVSVLGVLALVFFGLNHYNVQIDLLEAQYTVSVAWVMAGAALFGFIVSMLLLGPGRLAAGWNSRSLDREVRDLEGLLERREELRARLLAQHEALLERHERILLRHQALLDEHSHVVAERDEARAQLTAARNDRPAIAAGASGAATALRLLPQPKPQIQPQAQPQPQPQPQAQPMPASEPAATMLARAADPAPAAQVAQRTGIAAPASIERPVAQQPVRPVAAQPAATVVPAPAPASAPGPAPAPVPVVSTSSSSPSSPSPAASPPAANLPPIGKITRITEVTETPAPVLASAVSQPQPQPQSQPQAAHKAQPRQRPQREPVLPKLRARAVHARETTAASVTRLGERTQRGATNLRDTSGAWLTAQRDVQRERLARLRQRLASLRPDTE